MQNLWDAGAGFGGFFGVEKALVSLLQTPEKKTPKNFKNTLSPVSNIDEVPARTSQKVPTPFNYILRIFGFSGVLEGFPAP